MKRDRWENMSRLVTNKRDADTFCRDGYFTHNIRIPEWVCTCRYLNTVNAYHCARCDKDRT